MSHSKPSPALDFDTMVDVVSSILSEFNMGLLIYHLEDDDDPLSLRLAFANRVASEYTHADLSDRIGLTIGEAFPALATSELPEIYAEVAREKHSRNVGAYEYAGDSQVGRGFYAVKAFPMPHNSVGIVFENITVRKRLEEMLKRQQKGESTPGTES